ncbi:MAG: GTPase Era [Calditrichae bacterium]|nr:GTPase Era [Calditrichia bacterium]
MTEITNINHHAGYAAIFGMPNSGKSTLLNALLDVRLAIISARPQTTRRNVLGILNQPDTQCIFMDTPGVVKPKYELHKKMIRQIELALADADLLLMIVDAKEKVHPVEINLKDFNTSATRAILVLNKIDLVEKNKLLPLIKLYQEWYPFNAIIPVSALKKEGLTELQNEIQNNLPLSPPFYPKDMLTDQPEKFFVGELIREQIFRSFHEEIPYSTEVLIKNFKERKKGKDFIEAVIFVERDSQKGILIGNKGEKLKKIGENARRVIESFLDREVYLELHVKVNQAWRRSEEKLKYLGY